MFSRLLALNLLLCAGALAAPPSVIFCRVDAPESTQEAAKELKRLIWVATGREMRLSSEDPGSAAFRLLPDPSLPHDGFQIQLEDGGFIIAGNDEAPSGTWTVPGHGTLWGVCEFAERVLGVRWLFPGPLGEDVPGGRDLRFELREPIRGQPGFAVRSVGYLGETERESVTRHRPVLEWMRHQRLTNALHPFAASYGHSWDDYVFPADMEAHPEWKSSRGEAVRNGKVQFFCTTAPGIVELFAKRVIEAMDRNPKREMASISPTDGGGFCACERCSPSIETDPHGKPNHARAILEFYRQVAGIIAKERPGKRLGGFVYYNYQYPPANAPKLPENLSLCWAPLNYYGYGLLKPVYRDEFEGVMQRWSTVGSHLFYHNYSTWMRSFHGAPLPVSIAVLRRELPAAAANRAWGARMVGTSAWGVNAPINYLVARQLWNPQLDVEAAFEEWLGRAYGPGWKHMRELYRELDAKMLAHKEAQSPVYKGSQYEVNEDVMKSVYAPLFGSMERHYCATLAECENATQKARLEMFGHNLTQLYHALLKAGLIAEDPGSVFHRDDFSFEKFLKDMEKTFSLYEDKYGQDHGPIWSGEWSPPVKVPGR